MVNNRICLNKSGYFFVVNAGSYRVKKQQIFVQKQTNNLTDY